MTGVPTEGKPGQPPGAPPRRAGLRLLGLFAILCCLTALIYYSGLVPLFLKRRETLQFIHSFGPWGPSAFVALQALQVLVAPLPGEVTGFLGGYLYGPLLGTILSTIGLILGSLGAFGLTRVLGRPFVERFVDPKTMARFDFLLHHKGIFLVFMIFLIPGFPKDIFCYILGLGHLTMLEFFLIATTGRFLGTVLLTWGGHYLRLQQYGHLFTLAGLAVALLFFSIVFKDRIEQQLRKWHRRH